MSQCSEEETLLDINEHYLVKRNDGTWRKLVQLRHYYQIAISFLQIRLK